MTKHHSLEKLVNPAHDLRGQTRVRSKRNRRHELFFYGTFSLIQP